MALQSVQRCGNGLTIVYFCFCLYLTGTVAEILPSILWNPENPLFKNLGAGTRNVREFDKLSIICPTLVDYPIKRNTTYSKYLLYENVYLVDKKGYDSCNATVGQRILNCVDPARYIYYTVVFRPRTANQDDPKFVKGKEYYFINVASGSQSSLTNTQGGHCNDGMKMKIYVCKGSSDPKCPEGNNVNIGGWSDWSECLDGLQKRDCTNPSPASGGLPCVGPSQRVCTTKASQTVDCKGDACTDPTTDSESPPTPDPTTGSESPPTRGLPSRENRTGDKSQDGELQISKALFVGICLIILMFGICIGGVFGSLACHIYRRKTRSNSEVEIKRVPSVLQNMSRPTSTVSTLTMLSTISDSGEMVQP